MAIIILPSFQCQLLHLCNCPQLSGTLHWDKFANTYRTFYKVTTEL